jgi:hypothetical protein
MTIVSALSISGELQKVGAIAGLVAIPGLAVLALLYFSQARELKRLREWAGRAPERAQELQDRVSAQAARAPAGGQPARRVAAQPLATPGTPAARPQPAGAPRPGQPQPPAGQPQRQPAQGPAGQPAQGQAAGAPATAAAGQAGARAGEKPAAAGQPRSPAAPGGGPQPSAPAATPAAKPASPTAAPGGDAQPQAPADPSDGPARPPGGEPARPPAGDSAQPPSGTPAVRRGERRGELSRTERPPASAPAATASPPASGPAAPSTAAATAAPPRPRTAPPAAERTQVGAAALRRSTPAASPPARGERRPPRGGGAPRPGGAGDNRRIFLAAGAVAAIAVIVIAVTQLGGGGGSQPASAPATVGSGAGNAPRQGSPAPVTRGNVTVAVLNGTTTPGLAGTVATQLERGGFKRGQVTNAADQQRTATTIQYAPGQRQPAEEVASILKIPRIAVLDANTQAIAGPDAQVVVTVGSDRAQP